VSSGWVNLIKESFRTNGSHFFLPLLIILLVVLISREEQRETRRSQQQGEDKEAVSSVRPNIPGLSRPNVVHFGHKWAVNTWCFSPPPLSKIRECVWLV
jgi:hypothetical protein